jgi:hypothetical protein
MLQFSGLLITDAVAVKYVMAFRFTVSVAVVYVMALGLQTLAVTYVTALRITDHSGRLLRL